MGESKRLSDMATIRVIAALANQHFNVFVSLGENCPVDLIALSPEGKAWRIQVRYTTQARSNGDWVLRLANTIYRKGGGYKSVTLDRTRIDFFAIVGADNSVRYVPTAEIPTGAIREVSVGTQYGRLPEW